MGRARPGRAGRTELSRLATGARAAASKAGIAVDGARFKPHVTVARLKHPQDASSWVRLLDGYRGPAWIVDEVRLVASFLGEGPRNRPGTSWPPSRWGVVGG